MKQNAFKHFVFLWVVWLLFASPAFAEDSEVTRQTLKGIPGVYVTIEDLQPNLLKYEKYTKEFDLNKTRIQQDIEKNLTDAGIRLLSHEEWQQLPGRPALYVIVNTHETEKYWFAYDIKVELLQIVILQSSPAVKTLANTWSTSLTGYTNFGNLKQVNKDLGVLIRKFAQAYWSVNKSGVVPVN